MIVQFEINGKTCQIETPPMKRLLDVLREDLHLTGTKEGCGEGECGSCSVILNGELVNACLVPACQVADSTILTVEGLADGGRLSVVQQAFLEQGGAQCGICTPGMLMAATALLQENFAPDRDQIKTAIAGNLCRCTGYVKIIDAIAAAARERADEAR